MGKTPTWVVYVSESYRAASTFRVLVVITDGGDLGSAAIFDRATNITEFTNGRGSFFASEVCSTMQDVEGLLGEMERELAKFCQTGGQERAKIVSRSGGLRPTSTPPSTPPQVPKP